MGRVCHAAEAAFAHRPFFTAMSELIDTAYILPSPPPSPRGAADADEEPDEADTGAAAAREVAARAAGESTAAAAAPAGAATGTTGDAVDAPLEDGEHMTPADIETLASAAVHAAFEVNAALIVVVTVSGNTARLVAKYRPHCPIFCVTSDPAVARALQLHRGTHSLLVPPGTTVADCRTRAIVAAKRLRIVQRTDRVVAVHGSKSSPEQHGVQISMTHVL